MHTYNTYVYTYVDPNMHACVYACAHTNRVLRGGLPMRRPTATVRTDGVLYRGHVSVYVCTCMHMYVCICMWHQV